MINIWVIWWVRRRVCSWSVWNLRFQATLRCLVLRTNNTFGARYIVAQQASLLNFLQKLQYVYRVYIVYIVYIVFETCGFKPPSGVLVLRTNNTFGARYTVAQQASLLNFLQKLHYVMIIIYYQSNWPKLEEFIGTCVTIMTFYIFTSYNSSFMNGLFSVINFYTN